MLTFFRWPGTFGKRLLRKVVGSLSLEATKLNFSLGSLIWVHLFGSGNWTRDSYVLICLKHSMAVWFYIYVGTFKPIVCSHIWWLNTETIFKQGCVFVFIVLADHHLSNTLNDQPVGERWRKLLKSLRWAEVMRFTNWKALHLARLCCLRPVQIWTYVLSLS